ncbi:nucleotidyltransferase [Arthrobacter crystallopoietes]|uniref:nucleotidyltransferase domain-containing protein n=1 Tax=Crystallibacter crystallopoietes TaxID=37928 RepID=UPI003D1FB5A5
MASVSGYLNEQADFYTPKRDYLDAARNRRSAIESRLDKDLTVTTFIETGSLTHGTGLWLYSDVDYFVRFYDQRPTPTTALQRIKSSMQALYPNTYIRISSPAVKLTFSAGVSVELVPAYATGTDELYYIPDPTDSSKWMLSGPQKHLKYVNEANRHQSETKKVARLLKLWKAKRNVPVSSFYLEMRTAQYMKTQYTPVGVMDGLGGVMSAMVKDKMAGFLDPTFTAGFIDPTSTSNYHVEALSKLNTASSHLLISTIEDLGGDKLGAIATLRKVFE